MFDATPDGWKKVPFSEAVAINPRRQLARSVVVPFLDMASLPLNGASVVVTEQRPISSGGARFQAGDTLFARITPCAENGKLGFVEAVLGDGAAQGSTEFIVMSAKEGITSPEYVRCLAGWDDIRQQAIGLMEGTSGRQRVPTWAFDEIEVVIPPLDMQRRIAEVLRSVDEAIARCEKSVGGAISLWASLLGTHFHRADWEPTRPLPSGWTLTLLDTVAKRGSGHTPNKKIAGYWGGEIRWVSLQDTKRLDKVYISDTAETITPDGISNSSAVLHPVGTVVLSRDATVGRSAITTSEMAVSQHFMAYVCGPRLITLYLYYWLQRMKPIFERIGAGSTIKTIGLPFFKGLRIALPPMEVQREIATQMSEVDGLVASERSVLSRLRALRAAISHDLLSGRVRVPENDFIAAAIRTDQETNVDLTLSPRTVRPAFKRAVLAAEIVHQLHKDAKFGSVKHEKIVHLCELHAGLYPDLDRHAYKEAAGPYDPKARRSVEKVFRAQKWFAVQKDERRVEYVPLERCGGHQPYYSRYFSDRRVAIQNIIDFLKPMNTEQCEIVATLYAAWNDFLLDGETPTDHQIVQSVLTNWHPSKRNISEDRWMAALPWMRVHQLVPRGVGQKTRVATS
jgi:type I restriction enzyme, S subunit